MQAKFISTHDRPRTDHDRVLVNCAIGANPGYKSGQTKLRAAWKTYCPDAWAVFYDDYPDGCPPHSQMQYAFKIFALEEAIKAGFRYILWMDCVFQPQASIEPVWRHIEETGWYLVPQGDSYLHHWCSDAALADYGISRETASCIHLLFSGLIGLDMQHELGQTIWRRWKELYEKGSFNGPHRNVPGGEMKPWGHKYAGHVSSDPSVLGHRHDESALSFIVYDMGMVCEHTRFTTLEDKQKGVIRHGYY